MGLREGDLLISKDSNVGEIVILEKDYPDTMICGGIYKLPISTNKYYILAFIKSELFRQQIDFLVPRGSTLRHGKTKFLDCYIPFPNINADKTINYIEILMRSIINKEIAIQKRYEQIQNQIKEELENNQKDNKYTYSLPTIEQILTLDRMDSSLYSEKFRKNEFLLKNYAYGYSTIRDLGFEFVRGNNLAISVIGKSIYSSEVHDGFYTLILPKNITKYGTINKIEYLGNKSKMIPIRKGAVIFGAEGNEKGRSWVAINPNDKTITNFHGLTLYQKESNLSKSIFVKLFLDYFRATGMVDDYATGGNGGSLSIKYWDIIPFPNFPPEKESELVNLYYNPEAKFRTDEQTLDSFLNFDETFNDKAGIYELDNSMKLLQRRLQDALDHITNDKEVNIVF